MRKIIFGTVVALGLTVQSHAGLPEVIASKVADIVTVKINADKEVAMEQLKSASKVTIDGQVYNYIEIGERVVLVGNSGVVLLGDVNIGSVTNIVDIKKDAVVIGNVGVIVCGH